MGTGQRADHEWVVGGAAEDLLAGRVGIASADGPGTQEVMDVAFDPFGNVLVTGYFDGTPVVETTLTPDGQALDPSLGKGVFALKLDPQGNVIWAKAYGDDAGQLAGGIASDAAAKVYLGGALAGYLGTLHSTGGYDAFLLKLAP